MDIEQAKTFLAENHRGVLATYRQSGALQMSPILIGVDDEGRAIISSRETAYKVQVSEVLRLLQESPSILIGGKSSLNC